MSSQHLCSPLIHLAPPPFWSHIWLQSFRTSPSFILSSDPHLHRHFLPSAPTSSVLFSPHSNLTLLQHPRFPQSLSLSLAYLSQLAKHLFFAVFSPNLPSFISIFYSRLHFFSSASFSPLAITANLSILISIVLLFAAERSALTRETGKQTEELWDQVDLAGTLLSIWRNCYLWKSVKQNRKT